MTKVRLCIKLPAFVILQWSEKLHKPIHTRHNIDELKRELEIDDHQISIEELSSRLDVDIQTVSLITFVMQY